MTRPPSAYSTLHIDTSRERMRFPDFPMSRSYPDFPHHSQIARYFEDYVDHFGFRHRIRFRTVVERADVAGSDRLESRCALPDQAAMLGDMERERRRMFRRRVPSKRHTTKVDSQDYVLQVERQRAAGAERARRLGGRLPVPVRAASEAMVAA